MAVRLFVGNLPYSATEAELREHFSAVGSVSYISLPTDRETGRPRGFAFIEFNDPAQAQEAIRRFNNQPFKGGRRRALAAHVAATSVEAGLRSHRDAHAARRPQPQLRPGRGPAPQPQAVEPLD
jgi:cold-inducible RNA-binding protein